MKLKYEYITALACGIGSLLPAGLSAQSSGQEKISVEVVADSIITEEETGKTTVTAEDIEIQLGGGESINDIAFTMTNVQFDNGRGALSEDSILDISPSQISISGGRPYDNNFVVDGISTNSLMDSTNTNIHNYNELVGHPQTLFVNPNLVESVTVYESNVPAEFGGFGGGVFSVTTKDPSGELHFGASYGFKSDSTTQYLLNDDYVDTDVAKPLYEESVFSFYADVPLTEQDAVLFSYSKEKTVLENTQPHASFSYLERQSESVLENYSLKYQHLINDESRLVFSSLYAPEERQNYEQSLKVQKNTGWSNSIKYVLEDVDYDFEVLVGYNTSDSGREADANYYTYSNTESVDWVDDSRSSGSLGGFGVLNQEQEDIPVSFKYSRELANEATLSFGAQYLYQHAYKERPETNYAYSRANVASNIVSADGSDDMTVIDGEQALQQYSVYLPYVADVSLNSVAAWASYEQSIETGIGSFSYSAGLRVDYSDFLGNVNLGPRLSGTWQANDWLSIGAGYSRYYTADKIAYKIREAYPDSYIYRRTGTLVDGQLVYSSDDWTLYSHSKAANYSQADLDTPYSDEFSLSAIADAGEWGVFKAQLLKREGRDEFSRSEAERITYDRESGGTSFYSSYEITNNGFTDYESASLSWSKSWQNHSLELNTTFSDTVTSNYDYFEEYDQEEQEEVIYYGGSLMPYYEMKVQRSNMADPAYVNLIWNSSWWEDRLNLSLNGRWTASYEDILQDGTITLDGIKYSQYVDVTVPSQVTLNLNTKLLVCESAYGDYYFTAKVFNVLNELPDIDVSSSAPYQQGRTIWLAVDFNY